MKLACHWGCVMWCRDMPARCFYAMRELAERHTHDRSGEADKTENTGLAEGESGLPEGSS